METLFGFGVVFQHRPYIQCESAGIDLLRRKERMQLLDVFRKARTESLTYGAAQKRNESRA